ncbi:MAG: NAD(P)-dependent oxidoreductase [Solirubrobacteraceae bacterium]
MIKPGDTIGFVGLGNMGLPMARRLSDGGFSLRAFDVHKGPAKALVAATDARVVPTSAAVADGARAVVLMLPSSAVVGQVLLGEGLLDAMASGSIVIDMSSSRPMATRQLAVEATRRGIQLVDAPVSGGVSGAVAGTLTIMVGGCPAASEACEGLFGILGTSITRVGPVGAGHAVKALNNLLSATSLVATSQAVAVARAFDVDPVTLIDAINASSGRSGSSEAKFPRFILSGTYDSGFSAALMAKDIGVALELSDQLGVSASVGEACERTWAAALERLAPTADHTEVARVIGEAASLS